MAFGHAKETAVQYACAVRAGCVFAESSNLAQVSFCVNHANCRSNMDRIGRRMHRLDRGATDGATSIYANGRNLSVCANSQYPMSGPRVMDRPGGSRLNLGNRPPDSQPHELTVAVAPIEHQVGSL
jgi:hypothetical protein